MSIQIEVRTNLKGAQKINFERLMEEMGEGKAVVLREIIRVYFEHINPPLKR